MPILGVSPAAAPAFVESCRKHKGRKAALVWKGQVTDIFELKPDLETFDSLFVELWNPNAGTSGGAPD